MQPIKQNSPTQKPIITYNKQFQSRFRQHPVQAGLCRPPERLIVIGFNYFEEILNQEFSFSFILISSSLVLFEKPYSNLFILIFIELRYYCFNRVCLKLFDKSNTFQSARKRGPIRICPGLCGRIIF